VDGNPDNGIAITTVIRNEVDGRSIDFTQKMEDFGNDHDIQDLFDTLNALGFFSDKTPRSLCSAEEAQEHLGKLIDNDEDGYTELQDDCDDTNSEIHPGATEICNDKIDNDCDGYFNCSDSDCFGFPSCPLCTDADSDGYHAEGGCGADIDCDDSVASIHPGATEICNDEIDNDCDGNFDCADSDCIKDPECPQIEDIVLFNNGDFVENSDALTWSGEKWGGPESLFDGSSTKGDAPGGELSFETVVGVDWGSEKNYAGWGIFLVKGGDHTADVSNYNTLKFLVKTPVDLKIEVQEFDSNGKKAKVWLSSYGWDSTNTWQEIEIPSSDFSGIKMAKLFGLFMITAEQGGTTFYVANIRWTFDNNPPQTDAGADETVETGTEITLDGSGSHDPDGDPLIYHWTLLRPPCSRAVLNDSRAINPSFRADAEGDYEIRLTVNDGKIDSAQDVVMVYASGNGIPVANAGPDQNNVEIVAGTVITLDGSGSYDPDCDQLEFSWSITSKPEGSSAVLNDPAAMKT
jgi:hypothetical protein